MKISEALALGSASSFVLTVIYLQGYATTLHVNLFFYFSLNDYFRFAIQWIPRFLAYLIFGVLIEKALTRVEHGQPLSVKSRKHANAQMITIIVTACLSTILSIFVPVPPFYMVWAIAGPILWWMLIGWYVKEPKLVQNWSKAWLVFLMFFPALAISVFFQGLSEGQDVVRSDNQPSDVQILLKGATVPTTGKVLFVLDDYILLREQQSGVVALPKTEVTKIVHTSQNAKPALNGSSAQ